MGQLRFLRLSQCRCPVSFIIPLSFRIFPRLTCTPQPQPHPLTFAPIYLVGWGSTPQSPSFGNPDTTSIKAKTVNLIASVRTLMRSKLAHSPILCKRTDILALFVILPQSRKGP